MAYNVVTIYNSTNADSIASAALSKLAYPQTSLEDVAGLTPAQLDTMIATYTDATQHRVMVCLDSAFVAETSATGNIEITNAGGDNDMAMIMVNDGTDWILIGAHDVLSTENAVQVSAALVNSINALTSYHGYSASDNGFDFDVTAPAGLGATANAFILSFTTSTGGTTTVNVTNFTGGVTQVGATGDITTSQETDLDAKLIGVSDPTSDLAARTFDSLALSKRMALNVWEFLYPTLTRPRIIHYMGDHQEDSDEYNGTATTGAATTITDSGQAWAVDQFQGAIISITGGTGSGQSKTVLSNTATIITTAAWLVMPDNTSVYSISGSPAANTDFEDASSYIRTYLQDLSAGVTTALWKALIDNDDNIANKSAGQSTGQDLTALADYISRGNNMNDFAAL